jgi:hypothetical protein
MCALVRYLRRDISPSGRLGSGTVPVIAIPLALGRAARSSRLEPATAGPVSSVSTCAAKVRASLLKARTALSCCGILTAARFF